MSDERTNEGGNGGVESSERSSASEELGGGGTASATTDGEGTKGMSGMAWFFGFWIGVAVICFLIVAYDIGYNAGKKSGEKAAPTAHRQAGKSAAAAAVIAGPGKILFSEICGHCHTLSAAGTHGMVGPNLDQLKPSQERVLAAIANGGTGQGIMPKNIYTGQKAQEVAEFVSQAAGH